MTVYVACKFRPTDSRSYTYAYDGAEPLAPGDMVKVDDARGDGWKRVEVVSISDEAPPFACKPILGKVEPEPEVERDVFDSLDVEVAPDVKRDPLNSPIAF